MTDVAAAVPDLSVVIVSFNTRAMTLDCLRTLYGELGSLSAEVFVVDNYSKDGSVEAIREAFPQVVLMPQGKNLGFGAANNVALKQTRGRYIVLLNSDAFVKPGALQTLVGYMESHPRVGVAGPKLLNGDGTLQRSCYRFPGPVRSVMEGLLLTVLLRKSKRFGGYGEAAHAAEGTVDFVIGACWVVRPEALKAAGFFDENFFLYAEETDLAKRIHDAGWLVAFVPEAQVVHLGGASGGTASPRVFDEFYGGQERFIRKHHGGMGLGVYRAGVVLTAMTRMTLYTGIGIVKKPRAQAWGTVRMWWRILRWTLGARGPGLRG